MVHGTHCQSRLILVMMKDPLRRNTSTRATLSWWRESSQCAPEEVSSSTPVAFRCFLLSSDAQGIHIFSHLISRHTYPRFRYDDYGEQLQPGEFHVAEVSTGTATANAMETDEVEQIVLDEAELVTNLQIERESLSM